MSGENAFEFSRFCRYTDYKNEIMLELKRDPDSDLYYWRRLFSDFIGSSRLISLKRFKDIYAIFVLNYEDLKGV